MCRWLCVLSSKVAKFLRAVCWSIHLHRLSGDGGIVPPLAHGIDGTPNGARIEALKRFSRRQHDFGCFTWLQLQHAPAEGVALDLAAQLHEIRSPRGEIRL